jgi:hypothetical protein
VPLSRWNIAELAAALVRSGAAASIATSTVWRWLDAEQLNHPRLEVGGFVIRLKAG